MPNGIDLILEDHRHVDSLFAAYASSGDATIIGQVIDALTVHDQAEHAALYPLASLVLGDAAVIDRSYEAHSAVKRQIDHLTSLEGAPLADAFSVLQRLVKDHVADEEKALLPKLADTATEGQLDALGARILQAKQRVG